MLIVSLDVAQVLGCKARRDQSRACLASAMTLGAVERYASQLQHQYPNS